MPPETKARIAHHIPGRLRLIVPGLQAEPDLAERLSRELAQAAEVVEVTVRPATRSVLVRYEPNGRGPDTIVEALASVVRIGEAAPARRLAPPPGVTIGEMAAEWSHERWDRLNEGLKRATDGAVDIATVIPLFLLFLGARQVLIQPNLAALPWYTAIYYAFQSFNRYYGRPAPPTRSGWSREDEEQGTD
jgi:Heavy metal associated domain 2